MKPQLSASHAEGRNTDYTASIAAVISNATARNALIDNENYSRIELDSHANMVVLGSKSFIFESTSRTCNVIPFDPNLGVTNKILIVDGAITYECPYTGESIVLILRNSLHMPHLKHNIIAPFIM